jgi:hypothetical protein
MATEAPGSKTNRPADEEKADPAKKKPQLSWTSVRFTPFSDDGPSTLIPHYTAHFTLTRSDGEVFIFPVHAVSAESPLALGAGLEVLFDRVETYRTCSCTKAKKCLLHEVIC